ncbi:glycosyltransferase family 4 protein [Flavobacterium pedocola]
MDLKIAFLTPEYPHAKTGNAAGIGTSIKLLAKGLQAQGVAVSVLVYRQKEDGFFEDDGISVYQIKNVTFKGISLYLTQKKIERLIDTLYAENKITVVETPDWTGITSFIKPNKCPIVIRLHGSDTYFCHLDGRKVKWINRFLEKRALQKANGWLSVSRYTAEKTNEIFGLRCPFTIIHNGVDVALFNPANTVAKADTKKILYLGTLIRKKGLLELPEIFNRVIVQNPDAELILIGKDSADIVTGSKSTFALMKPLFTKEAFEKVNYLGSVPYTEVARHINEAAVCVYPSFAEAFPVSWLEAMAMQKAIVASNIGWSSELLSDGVEGYLVHPKEHGLFAERITAFLNDDALQKQFGEKAREKVLNLFSIDVIAKQNIAYYNTI